LQGIPWKLTARGPKHLRDHSLSADLAFTPRLPHAPSERRFFSRELAGADHHWVVANPLCDVTGTIRMTGEPDIPFIARGYHDHNYGTGPIGPGLQRWFWGRALLDDRAVTFHFAHPQNPDLPDEVHVLEASDAGAKQLDITQPDVDWAGLSPLLLRYPKRAAFGDILRLSNPRIIDLAPFYMRLIYDADVRGRKTTAFTEIAYPHRLRWPVLGRMIEMSILKVGEAK
jgi:carotenoid 1,2-hydratase